MLHISCTRLRERLNYLATLRRRRSFRALCDAVCSVLLSQSDACTPVSVKGFVGQFYSGKIIVGKPD